jgi:hypothetical protein
MQSDSFESGQRLYRCHGVSVVLIVLGVGLHILPSSAANMGDPQVRLPVNGQGLNIGQRLATIEVSIEFNNATIQEAFQVLSAESKKRDPDQTGVSFKVDPDAFLSARRVSLTLHDVTLFDAMRNICKLGNVKSKFEGDGGVHIVSSHDSVDATEEPTADQTDSRRIIVGKLQTIVIDKVNLKGLDIAKALQLFAQRSKALDPDKVGVNFVLGNITPADGIQRQITLATSNIALADLLVLITQQTNLRYFVEDNAVYFKP